jgi:hypothetical protein
VRGFLRSIKGTVRGAPAETPSATPKRREELSTRRLDATAVSAVNVSAYTFRTDRVCLQRRVLRTLQQQSTAERPQGGLSLWCQSTSRSMVLGIPTEDLQSIASVLAAGYLRDRDQLRRAASSLDGVSIDFSYCRCAVDRRSLPEARSGEAVRTVHPLGAAIVQANSHRCRSTRARRRCERKGVGGTDKGTTPRRRPVERNHLPRTRLQSRFGRPFDCMARIQGPAPVRKPAGRDYSFRLAFWLGTFELESLPLATAYPARGRTTTNLTAEFSAKPRHGGLHITMNIDDRWWTSRWAGSPEDKPPFGESRDTTGYPPDVADLAPVELTVAVVPYDEFQSLYRWKPWSAGVSLKRAQRTVKAHGWTIIETEPGVRDSFLSHKYAEVSHRPIE